LGRRRVRGWVSSRMDRERDGAVVDPGGDADDPIGVYLTFPDDATAATIADALVEGGLAACVHVFPAGTSTYRWEGRVVREAEVVAWAKTRRGRLAALTAAVVARHPYDVPCVVGYPTLGGWGPYLDWVRREAADAT
jgi:periplasmic divalent cation tolerance protein